MTEKIECVVIGAGVVGLAVARGLAISGRETILLESGQSIGTGISSRNSEVIHAGIYYPQNSLKAKLCVYGKELLYKYCQEHNIPHKNCGKLIVATDESQTGLLLKLWGRAQSNNVNDLIKLDAASTSELEPDLSCIAALFSPSTGIIDSHAYMLSLLGDFEAAGGVLAVVSPVVSGEITDQGTVLNIASDPPMEICAQYVINCSGLYSTTLAANINGLDQQHIPQLKFAKGNYFALSQRSPFNHLIYPMPDIGGLGIHLTLDLNKRARFGPDVEWLDKHQFDFAEPIDFSVDPNRIAVFENSIRRYWPDLPANSLHADYAGIRPKITTNDNGEADFMIHQTVHGNSKFINLYGIESPGLTASLAIAEYINRISI